MKNIKVIIKEPGKSSVEKTISNSLESLQEIVGGPIETVTLASDLCIICNEEGKLKNLPYNITIFGVDFVGTLILVGVNKDKFADIPITFGRVIGNPISERIDENNA